MDNEYIISQALKDLDTGRYSSLRACAAAYNLDHTTLSRRRRGQRSRVISHANQQKLSPIQEDMLAKWLLEAERAGHAFNHRQLQEMASIVHKASGGDGKLGKLWARNFIKRHPDLHTKKGVSIASQRVHDLYSSNVSQWFMILLSLLTVYKIKTKHIYNMDETGNVLGPCTNQTIVGSSLSKRSYVSRPEQREWVSVIECISAIGKALVPLVIFKGKSVQQQWFLPHKTPDWYYTSSDNAYTTNDLGLQWLREIFIPQTTTDLNKREYRLLILDGHRSHCTTEFMWECHQNKIIPYYLIAHASHILQPLDLCVFSSLKRSYRATVNFHSQLDDTAPVKKQRFLEYYQSAKDAAITIRNIKSSFKSAGKVPYNPNKVLSSPFILQVASDSQQQRSHSPQVMTTPTEVQRTPTNHRELDQAVTTLHTLTPLDYNIRDLFAKTGRTIDRLHFRLAEAQRQGTTYKRLSDDHAARSKKQGPVDLNRTFANIDSIKKAYDKAQLPPTTTRGPIRPARLSKPTPTRPPTSTEPFLMVAERLRAIGGR